MNDLGAVFRIEGWADAVPVGLAALLLLILIVSFRSRAVVFCQYLAAMTGIRLKPAEVRRIFREKGKAGVREMFLDRIIREDLKEGPMEIPDAPRPEGAKPAEPAAPSRA